MTIALILAGAYAGVLLAAFAWNAIVWIAQISGGLFSRAQVDDGDSSTSPHVVVTLVHGTWARRAAWTMPSSPLCRAICKEADGPVRFERFMWSGWNTITSRHKAVARLISQLQVSQARWPHARHFVIGHSHGGNIAFQAMREQLVAARIVGLACLSTPFLCVSPRELGPVGRIALWWFPVVVAGVCLVPVVELFPAALEETVGGIAVVVALGVGFVISPWIRRFATTISDALQYPNVPPSKVVLIRTFGDEASAALGAAEMISWIAGRIWFRTSRLIGQLLITVETWRSHLARRWRLVAPACVLLLGTAILALVTANPPAWLAASAVFSGMILAILLAILSHGGYVAALLGSLLIAALATPSFLLMAVLGIAAGPELLIAGLVSRVTAESTPPGGGWTVWQVPKDPMHAGHSAFLMHSATYQNEESLGILARWFGELDQQAAKAVSKATD